LPGRTGVFHETEGKNPSMTFKCVRVENEWLKQKGRRESKRNRTRGEREGNLEELANNRNACATKGLFGEVCRTVPATSKPRQI